MQRITKTLLGILLGYFLAGNVAHASIIQSMTIEEIGVASGGLGTSTTFSGGGGFAFSPGLLVGFSSIGSTDGAILMGVQQGDSAFATGLLFAGVTISPNTLAGAPSGMINGNNLGLELSGWGIDTSSGFGYFPLPPDIGTLITSVSPEDFNHYFYTADWHHQITDADDPSGVFVGFTTYWHLEGVATIPEPGTLWLFGASTFGLLVSSRRKHAKLRNI